MGKTGQAPGSYYKTSPPTTTPLGVHYCGSSVHLLHSDLDSVRDPDAPFGQEESCDLLMSVYHIPKLDLSSSKPLLIPLKPGLVILDEEVTGLTSGQQRGTQLVVLHVAWDGPNHQLVGWLEARVRGWAPRLKPILSFALFVSKSHDGGVLDLIQAWLSGEGTNRRWRETRSDWERWEGRVVVH